MAQSVSFGNFVDPEEQAIARRRAMAEALQAQSMAPIQQQTAGGRVVRNSPIEGIAKLAQALAANKVNSDTDERQKAFVTAKKAQGASDIQGIVEALRGKAGVPAFETPANEMGDEAVMQKPVAAQGPDTAKALALALNSDNPMAQGMGGTLMAQMMPKSAKWEKADRPNADGSVKTGYVDVNSPKPWDTFQEGGTAPVKGIAVNGAIKSPYAIGEVTPKQADAPNLASDLLIPGPNGSMVPNRPLIGAKKEIAKSGASNVSVGVNTAMKPFLGEIGKGAAEQVNSDFTGARAAQSVLQNVEQIKSGLGNAILGPGANVRVSLAQIGQVLGVNGKDATEQLQNTRNVMQGLARQELAASGSMKGQGQITESERAILRKAEAGQIDEMTKPEMETFLTAVSKTAKHRIGVHEQNLERLSKDPAAAEIIKFMKLPTQAGGGGSSVTDQADAILRGGK